jgi:WD40 repeat protein
MAWLYSITSNLCKLRTRSRSRQPDNEFIEDQDSDTLDRPSIDHYQEESIFRSLDDALKSLPDIHREILTLHYLAGMKVMDMAKYLGTSPRTIARRLSDARLQLKEEMLAMMKTGFEEQRLSATFTIRIVEMVKRIRINPFSQTKSLPWGLSFATGIMLAVLGLNSHIGLFNISEAPLDSSLLTQTKVQNIGEFPVKALSISKMTALSGMNGDGGGVGFSGQQNSALMAPKGEGGKIPDKPSAQIGKGRLGGIAYSPDGKIFAVVTGLGVRLYDTNNLNEIGVLQEDKIYYSIAFSPDGKIIAVGNINSGVSLWDMQTQKLMGLIPDVQGYNIAFSPDSKILAVTGWQDNNIHLCDIQKMEQIGLLQGHAAYVGSVAFTPDGKTLVSGSNDKTTRLWDIQEQKQIGLLNGNKNAVYSVAISPDGKILASGGEDGELLLWNIQEQKLIGSLKGHNSWVGIIVFSSDGKILASTGADSTIRIWDVQEQKQITLIQIDSGRAWIAFHPDGRTLASAAYSAIRFWDIQDQKQTGIIDGFMSAANVAFSPDSKIFASGSFPYVIFWNAADQKQIGEVLISDDDVFQEVTFSPDGKIIAGACYKSIYLIDVQLQKQIGLLRGHTDYIRAMAFSPDSKLIASGSPDMTIRLWDVQQQKEVWMQNCPSGIRSIAFTPDGKYLVWPVGIELTIHILDVKTKNQKAILQNFEPVSSIAISSDGKLLAAGTINGAITIWDFKKEVLIDKVALGNDDAVWKLAFSPDDKWLASQSGIGTCRIWDVETMKQLADLKGNKGIYNMAFSPDGKWLATSGGDGTILLWEVDIPVQGKSVNPMGKATGTWGDVKKDQLFQNYPNPFNPETWIPFSLSKSEHVKIKIYNSTGLLVKTLDLGSKEPGLYTNREKAAYWDGKNEAGDTVASDVYYCVMQAGEYTSSRKMVMVR